MDSFQNSDQNPAGARSRLGLLKSLWKRPILDKETARAINSVQSKIDSATDETADCRILLATTLALISRIKASRPRRALEIVTLLGGVADVAIHGKDVDKARTLYQEAYAAFAQSVGSGNRLRFFGGASLGAIAMGVATVLVLTLQSLGSTRDILKQVANPDVLVGVTFFSLAGSLTSIFIRLNKIDLVEEDLARMVYLAGALQPMVAMGFMCVVYVVIATPLLPLNISGQQKTAIEFVAAFLCGFSEKFAPALLERVEGSIVGGRFSEMPRGK